MPALEGERTAADASDELDIGTGQVGVEPEVRDRGRGGLGRNLVDVHGLAYDLSESAREVNKIVWEGVLVIAVTLRFDVKYAEETAVVKAVNVKVGA